MKIQLHKITIRELVAGYRDNSLWRPQASQY